MKRLSLAGMVAYGLGVFVLGQGSNSLAHDGHHAATYRISPSASDIEDRTHLRLNVVSGKTGDDIAPRFTLTVDGAPYVPNRVGRHGLRFVSIYQ